MRTRALALLAFAALVAGCAHAPVQDVAVATDSARDVVLVLANPVSRPAPHAASNVLGYGSGDSYRNGQRAMSTLAELKQRHGLREVAGWPIKPLGVYCAVLRPQPGTDRDALLLALAADQRVQIAAPLQEFEVYSGAPAGKGYDDPYLKLQRGFADIDAGLAQRASRGLGVEIALVDTGVDVAHPDLKGRISGTFNMVDDDAAAFRGDRHGTEVAGVIAGVGGNRVGIVGIAPQATLSVYKACWQSGGTAGARCNTFTLAKALAALFDTDARIINLSLGGPSDRLLELLLSGLLRQDRIVVAALPPDGKIDGFPAEVPGVMVVASSQSGQAPEGVVLAPGKDILTTQPDGGYDFASGSSLAAAHVSGIAALMLSLSPDLHASMVRTIIGNSSQGAGRKRVVNAAAAVAVLPDARVVDLDPE